jgi:hypothetical protein
MKYYQILIFNINNQIVSIADFKTEKEINFCLCRYSFDEIKDSQKETDLELKQILEKCFGITYLTQKFNGWDEFWIREINVIEI